MPRSGPERHIVAVMGAVCGLLWGYSIPTYMNMHWVWRLLAIPSALAIGGPLWYRAVTATPAEAIYLIPVSKSERVVTTLTGTMLGLGAGFGWPWAITKAFPPFIVAIPLGVTLAVVFGTIGWRHPALFFKIGPFECTA